MRYLLPLVFGLAGTAILLGLGTWQVQRLAWKESVLAEIDARIGNAPVTLPAAPVADRDRYLPVQATGNLTDRQIRVLASRKQIGAGYRIIRAFETEGRTILVDVGFAGIEGTAASEVKNGVTIAGNLHWPDEVDGFTPEPDLDGDIWFARDVPLMAAHLGTQPILIVAREMSDPIPGITPFPVDISGIPNDHLQYAITWFSLAAVWIAMTGYFLWRMPRRIEDNA